MCGISGAFNYADPSRPYDREMLQAINRSFVHRGPDDEGYFFAPGVALAMRRLSIIDRVGGHQPIANEDESVRIVFNGEIYNFQQLREDLLRRGHRFRTHADTEVILHLYEDFGARCVDHLDGMFAFAIYDARNTAEPVLFLARDRLGKKPLYVARLQGELLFASEATALLKNPAVSRNIDQTALHHYLSLLYVPAPHSIFSAIEKLLPGHCLTATRSGVVIQRYWNPQDLPEAELRPEDCRKRVKELLYKAVEKRMVAEVPIGAFLSGGVDSSSVVAVMSDLQSQPVRTFSIGFEGPASHNELPIAAAVARHCRTEHHPIVARPNIVELLPDLVQYIDEPFAISSALPTLLLARAARPSATVVLTGDGGDEVFAGYEHYYFERWASLWRSMPSMASSVLRRFAPLAAVVDRRTPERIRRFLDTAQLTPGARRLGWSDGFDEATKLRLYAERFRFPPTGDFLEARLAEASTRLLRADAAANATDVLVRLPDEMLTKVDRMTMAASVEARSPLLDKDLFEFAYPLSIQARAPGLRRSGMKTLLRQVAGELLPATVLRRRKWGFNVPLDAWFRGPARSFLRSVLTPARLERLGFFDPRAVSDLLDRHAHGHGATAGQLYALVVFQIWWEQRVGTSQ